MNTLEIRPLHAVPVLPALAGPLVLAPVKAAAPAWSRKKARAMDGTTLLRRLVGLCLLQVRPNAEAIAHGSRDPGHVHQLRVGLRRLRSAARGLRAFAGALPHGWEAALMPVFKALGEARDRHVLATEIAPRLRAAGADLVDDAGHPGSDAAMLRQLVCGERFQDLLRRLSAFAEADDPGVPDGREATGRRHLEQRLQKLARDVARSARAFDDLSFEQQHAVRKRLKQLRYLAEFAAPAYGQDQVRRWLRRVAPAQDALGRHMDRMLAGRHFAARADVDPAAGFAAGWLRAKADRSARQARRALLRLRATPTFW